MAIIYDAILLVSIWFLAAFLWLAIFSKGLAVSSDNLSFKLYLVFISVTITLWFWTHGGQTTGMAAWKIKLVDDKGQDLRLNQAMLRICLAIPLAACGVGIVWALIDRHKQTLYDRLAKTMLINHPN